MNKPLLQRSKLLYQLRCYFRIYKHRLYVLTPEQRSYLDKYVFCLLQDLPPVLPSAIALKLTDCALIIRRENKRIQTIEGKRNDIEGLNMHNTHPRLYKLCMQLKIHTIAELDIFMDGIKSGSLQSKEFMRQYPLIFDLLDFYDGNRNTYKSN